MVPPPCQTTGRSRQRRRQRTPCCNWGVASQGHRIRQTAGCPAERARSPASPADRNGSHPKGVADLPLTKGRPREQCRRRPQGRNGCEEDDRSSDPRFRSAPTERQASVGCEGYLQHRQRLSSTTRQPAVPHPVRRSPDPRRSSRPLRQLHENGVHGADPGRIRPRIAPHSALVFEFGGQTSNEAALRAAGDTVPRAAAVPSGQRPRRRRALQLDDSTVLVRDVRLVFFSPGQRWPDVSIRPSSTSSTPPTPCHPTGPQRQRRTRGAG